MQDRFFFPLAAVLAGAFVFTALQPFAYRPPSGPLSGGGRNAEDLTAQGDELHRFVPGSYNGLQILDTPDGKIMRITRQASEVFEDPRSGPHIVLAEDLEYAFEARPVEITIEARSGPEFGASEFEANYYARAEGESGWRRFPLTPEFQPYTFTVDMPARGPTEGYDYLGIRPVAPDKSRVMDVRSVHLRTVGPKKAPPPSTPG